MPVGPATRTGIWRTSRPSSAVPASCAPPPVRMIPAGSIPCAAAGHLVREQLERLAHPGLDDPAQLLAADGAPGVLAEDRDADLLVRSRSRRSQVPWRTLSSSATWMRRLDADRDVVRHVVAADRQDGRVERRAVREQGEVDRAGADVGDRDAQLLLGLGQHGLGGCERVGDELVDLHAGELDALGQVLDRGRRGGDDVGLDLEPQRAHARAGP